jgi:hypothetical protein
MGRYCFTCLYGIHGVCNFFLLRLPPSSAKLSNPQPSTFNCIGVVPVARKIVLDLEGKRSKSSSVLLVTIWELGEAAGPLIIAPLSEGPLPTPNPQFRHFTNQNSLRPLPRLQLRKRPFHPLDSSCSI